MAETVQPVEAPTQVTMDDGEVLGQPSARRIQKRNEEMTARQAADLKRNADYQAKKQVKEGTADEV